MIQSMTGFAALQHADDDACYVLEVRSLNNRYLKLSIKLPDYLQFIESDIEKLLRRRLVRGSVTFSLRVRTSGGHRTLPINLQALNDYAEKLTRVELPQGVQATMDLATLATLPGVCIAPDIDDDTRQRKRETVMSLADRALDGLIAMRRQEGAGLQRDLLNICEDIKRRCELISSRSPVVVSEYHDRLKSRVQNLLKGSGVEVEADTLAREVAICAERCDISEELVRTASHLDQVVDLCDRDEQVGRTLDFLTQELLREANTIASKCNDTEIAVWVVETKGLIDRLREQVQNVE